MMMMSSVYENGVVLGRWGLWMWTARGDVGISSSVGAGNVSPQATKVQHLLLVVVVI